MVQDHQGHVQPAGVFAFWSIALGAIPAIWDVILGFLAPDMDWTTLPAEPRRDSCEATAPLTTAVAGRPQLGAAWSPGSLGPSWGGSAVCGSTGASGFA